ncbi:MAG TPA: glycosyltransferase family 2 protein [Candidatus Moranbacteria bacterium]|nr:glycosyltransferase family 2 protein [Candidatus Moranbacteria bacterium]
MIKVSVIVVTYNNQNTIEKCLSSILESDLEEIDINLVIIDNNSQDQTTSTIKKTLSEHQNLKSKKHSSQIISHKISSNKVNVGFAKAVNQGINLAQKEFNPDYFFLFNPDAYLTKNCLLELIKKSSINSLSSPLIIDHKSDQPWFSGGKINWLKMRTEHMKCNLPQSVFYSTDYLTGCALLIPRKIIQKIGLFNEKLFLYYEDADFSLRAKKAGFSLEIIPTSTAYHQESQSFLKTIDKKRSKQKNSSQNKTYYLSKSGLYFFHKHYPKWGLPYFWLVFALRITYHSFFSKKYEVVNGMKSFLKKN